MKFSRASGILLHPTSLPGEYGIGDLGPEAFSFVNFLEDAGQTYWQILPLGPTGYGDSPYQCFSAFAGNTLLISPESLIEDGLLTKKQIADAPKFPKDRVDFGSVYEWKNMILPIAFQNYLSDPPKEMATEFGNFRMEHGWWLDDYAAFRVIKAANDQKPWYEWPEPLKDRDSGALDAFRVENDRAIQAEKFQQFLFFRQWSALKEYAHKHGVRMIGDIPIFVALDSSDVWCNRSKFKLEPDGTPSVVSGVPPDYFSKTGQLWGNPIYDWDAMRADGFQWWIARVAFALRTVDLVRFDHFRGFAAAWEVPGGEPTAENGEWVNVPGRDLFNALRHALGEIPVIAEDLGVITPDVLALRDDFGFQGMKILQFAFGGDANNQDLPHNYTQNCVAYTGTHDNDTAVGWWKSQADVGSTRDKKTVTREHEFCLRYLASDGAEINWDLIRAIWSSVADTAITPVQDLLGVDNKGRMNLPASKSGNWSWRYKKGELTPEIGARLRTLTETFGRTIPLERG
jgi:4-alpha-glucanotransferase